MKILLIEDDMQMQELLKDYLQNYDFEVFAYEDPIKALESFDKSNQYDLIVLDLMMPKLDGFEVSKRIRKTSEIPILISSARDAIGDKELAFEVGADDYLAKPYEPKELIIRISSILRRMVCYEKIQSIGEFTIHEDRMEIYQEDHLIELTKIEYDIFSFFLNNPNKVLSRESIANFLGLEYNTIKDRTIDVHISNIRNKIFDNSKSPKYIKSVWGVGYKFMG